MGFEEIISILVFLIFILYRFFAGSKKFDETKPGKEPRPQNREKQQEEKTDTSLDDIFRELFDEPEEEREPQPRQQTTQKKQSPHSRRASREGHYLDSVDEKSANKPEDYGSWAEEVTQAEKKLKEIQQEMAEDPLVKQEKEVFKTDVYDIDYDESEKEGGNVDLRMAIIHKAILDRPTY